MLGLSARRTPCNMARKSQIEKKVNSGCVAAPAVSTDTSMVSHACSSIGGQRIKRSETNTKMSYCKCR